MESINNQDNNSNGVGFTFCTRCGAEFDPKSRYCLKCGNINPDHPDNANMVKYINKNGGAGYRIGSGQALFNKKVTAENMKSADAVIGDRTGSFNICFATNMVLYLVLSLGTLLYYYILSRGNFTNVVISNISTYLLIYAFIFLYLYSFEILFIKLNRRWWLSLIPIVNMCVLVEVVNDSKRLMYLSLLPVVGQIIWIFTIYRLGTSFNKNGFLTLFFPFIMIPIISYGGSSFHWVYYTSKDNSVEFDYFLKKIFYSLIAGFVALSIVFIVYRDKVSLVKEAGDLDSAYMMNSSRIVLEDVRKRVVANQYTCDFNMDEFYFYFEDLTDYYDLPFSIFYHPIEAYVKVEKVKENGVTILGEYEYYMSMSDGNIGFEETSTKELTMKNIKKYNKVSNVYNNGNHCYLDKK